MTMPMTLSGKRLTLSEKDDEFVRRKMICHRTEHDSITISMHGSMEYGRMCGVCVGAVPSH